MSVGSRVIESSIIDKTKIQRKLTLAICVPLVMLILWLTYHWLTKQDSDPPLLPKIQGSVLRQAQDVAPFVLINQHKQHVSNSDLLGKWHFIAFGYTQCPDICPTTLMTMTQLAQRLSQTGHINETGFVFYTVDPIRDSAEVLSQYVNYFDHSFIALRPSDNDSYSAFERSLGIKAQIKTSQGAASQVQVSHSIALFLLNPEAKLQAVFLPDDTSVTAIGFDSAQLYSDYLKIKNYYHTLAKSGY